MKLEEILRTSISRAGVVRVRNALNPLLWATAIVTPLAWIAAWFFRDDVILEYTLVVLGMLPILSTLTAYFIFLVRDPDRLQSEEYVLKQRELSIIERKGAPPLVLDESLKETRPVPEPEALPQGSRETDS